MSKLQEISRKRNWLKFKLAGLTIPHSDDYVTLEEVIIIKQILDLKKALLGNFNKNSRAFAIKIPEHRCFSMNCRNKAKFKTHEEFYGKEVYFCKKCYTEYLEIYEK
jgi:hypothetical protein